MHDIFTVAKFTMHDMLSRKSYIISTIIILVLIVLGFNAPNILSSFNQEDTDGKVLVIDRENLFEDQISSLNQPDSDYELIAVTAEPDNLNQKLIDGELKAAISVEPTSTGLKLNGLVKNLAVNQLPNGLTDQLSALYQNIQIQKLHLTEKQLQSISPTFEISLTQAESEEIGGNIFAMMIISLILFYAIYFCAYQVSSSITTEKTSKIIETLVTSTSPNSIVIGKTLGIGLVGLLQMVLITITALISAYAFLDPQILNTLIDTSQLTITLGLIAILYFVLGYAAYALLYALTGSTVGKPEDIQSANTPVAMLAVISFYLAYFTLTDPTSNLNVFAALFPFSSPFCMPIRMMMGLASPLEVCGSLIILLITIVIIARIAVKIYSNAILHYGTKMTWKEIWQNYKEKM